MTPQEAFERAALHLLAQGRMAAADSPTGLKCYYRSPDGLRCAVGALIPDELYDPRMENQRATAVIDEFSLGFLAEANIWDKRHELTLLDELQWEHDRPAFWQAPHKELIRIGEHFGLKVDFLLSDSPPPNPKEST